LVAVVVVVDLEVSFVQLDVVAWLAEVVVVEWVPQMEWLAVRTLLWVGVQLGQLLGHNQL